MKKNEKNEKKMENEKWKESRRLCFQVLSFNFELNLDCNQFIVWLE